MVALVPYVALQSLSETRKIKENCDTLAQLRTPGLVNIKYRINTVHEQSVSRSINLPIRILVVWPIIVLFILQSYVTLYRDRTIPIPN